MYLLVVILPQTHPYGVLHVRCMRMKITSNWILYSYLANSFSVHCRQINIMNIIVQLVCLKNHTTRLQRRIGYTWDDSNRPHVGGILIAAM